MTVKVPTDDVAASVASDTHETNHADIEAPFKMDGLRCIAPIKKKEKR
jgi:hypothetical protein